MNATTIETGTMDGASRVVLGDGVVLNVVRSRVKTTTRWVQHDDGRGYYPQVAEWVELVLGSTDGRRTYRGALRGCLVVVDMAKYN